jgi:hypothetical protein
VADLTGYGIGYLVIHSPVRTEVAAQLDGTTGLARTGVLDPNSSAWAVTYPTGRALLRSGTNIKATSVLASGTTEVDDTIARSGGARTVLLNERVETGWHAQLDGVPLTGGESADGLQTFEVPATSGQLRVTPDRGLRRYGLLMQVAVIVAVAVAAAPRVRRERQGMHR